MKPLLVVTTADESVLPINAFMDSNYVVLKASGQCGIMRNGKHINKRASSIPMASAGKCGDVDFAASLWLGSSTSCPLLHCAFLALHTRHVPKVILINWCVAKCLN